MKTKCVYILIIILFFFFGSNVWAKNTVVVLETSLGTIEIELFDTQAPLGTSNFLSYVDSGFYNGVIFHRVIPGFMIQGGGFDKHMNKKETKPPIINEAKNGIKNLRGTVSYARTQDIQSATSQFFINLVDNNFLDYKNDMQYGYAVFGKVINGMNVVDAIAKVKTGGVSFYKDVPVKPIVIIKAVRK